MDEHCDLRYKGRQKETEYNCTNATYLQALACVYQHLSCYIYHTMSPKCLSKTVEM